MPRIIAVDPGLRGAICFLDPGNLVAIHDMPVGLGGWVDAIRLRDFIRKFQAKHPAHDCHAVVESQAKHPAHDCHAVVENVWSHPKEGVTSAHRFGRALGVIHAVLVIELGSEPYLVIPQVWKRYFGLIKQDKEASRQLALQRWPMCGHFLARKLDHQRAEALLIAEWYLHHLKGKPEQRFAA
jgi:hypothetical protein